MRNNLRTDKVKRSKNKLAYQRTEIQEPPKDYGSRFFYVLLFVSFVSLLYIVFISNVFKVSDIQISGTKDIKQEDIKAKISRKLGGQAFKNNILFFDTDWAAHEIKKEHALKNLEVKKHYPNKVEVKVGEYTSELQWFSANKYYLIDETGKVVGEFDSVKEGIPVVYDKKNLPVQVGKSLVTKDFIGFIKYLNTGFPSVRAGAKMDKIEINETFNEIIVNSNLGFYIIFDTTRDPETELKNLQVVLESKEIKGKKIAYLDMRIKNKVFYR